MSWHNDLQKAVVPLGNHWPINLRHSYIRWGFIQCSFLSRKSSYSLCSETTWTTLATWCLPWTFGADHHILGRSAFQWYIIQSTSWTARERWREKSLYIVPRFGCLKDSSSWLRVEGLTFQTFAVHQSLVSSALCIICSSNWPPALEKHQELQGTQICRQCHKNGGIFLGNIGIRIL